MRRAAAVVTAAVLIGLAAGVSAYSQQPSPQPAAGTAVLAGQVIDDTTKRPLGGVVVTLSLVSPPARAGGPATNVRRASAVGNAEGRFVFRDVPAGKFTVTSSLAGYAAGAVGQKRPGGPSRPLDVADTFGRPDRCGYYLAVVTEVDPDEAADGRFLETLIPMAIRVVVPERGTIQQPLRIGGGD